MEKSTAVGIVGLGKMGRPMARHIAAKGYAVVGYDVNPEAIAAADRQGIATTSNLQALASRSDLIIIVVGFDSEVEEAIFDPKGILAHARRGLTLVIASTVAPQTIAGIAARLKGSGISLVDAPLTRGEEAAEKGNLLIMLGGEPEAVALCRPVFEAYSNSIHHLGPIGSGQVGKLVNNLILWSCMSANFEGMKLARALGVDTARLRAALVQSSANNWSLETRAEEKPVPWAEKDMTIVLKEADKGRVSLPLCGVVKEVIKGFKLEYGFPTPESR